MDSERAAGTARYKPSGRDLLEATLCDPEHALGRPCLRPTSRITMACRLCMHQPGVL